MKAGVKPGLPLAEARSLLTKKNPHFERHDADADRLALEDLAAWSECFSPFVSVEDFNSADSLLMEAGGVAHLFGGEESLAQQIKAAFAKESYFTRIAMADTIGAAWAVAHFGTSSKGQPIVVSAGSLPKVLSSLPVESLRLPGAVVETLHALDLRRIGQILRLPRESLPSRFGLELLERLDQALGRTQELCTIHRPQEPVAAEWDFEPSTTDRRVLEAAGRILLERLLAKLSLRNEGVLRFWCGLKFGPQESCEGNGFSVELVSPSSSQKHLAHLLDLRWERITLPGEVLRMRLEIAQTAPVRYRQRELFEEESNKDRERRQEFAALINRLSSRLGTEAVLKPVLMPDHQPEHAVRLLPVVRGHPQNKSKPKPQRGKRPPSSPPPACIKFPLARPVRLLPEPVAIQVMSVVPDGPPIRFSWKGKQHVVAHWWGPERIETGWWRSRDVRRDYYRVETGEGGRFWLFRDLTAEGEWFLQGIFE